MKNNKKRHYIRNLIIIMLLTAIVGTAVTAKLYFVPENRTYASAHLQFTFEGAANGIAPNGERFSIADLTSDEVLEMALDASNMTGTYTVENIRDNFVVTGKYPEDFVDQVMSYDSLLSFETNRKITLTQYYPTLYILKLYDDFDENITSEELQNILGNIVKSYRTYFENKYAVVLDWEEDNIYDLEYYDYTQQKDILERTISEQARYAREMYEKEPEITINGMKFNDIYIKFNKLIEGYITPLNAEISLNAYTKNKERLLTQYEYQIEQLNNRLEKLEELLGKAEEMVSSYEKNQILYLSTAETFTKINGNSSDTYDALVTNRKQIADEITGVNSKIRVYQLRINDLVGDGADDNKIILEESELQDEENTLNESVNMTESQTSDSLKLELNNLDEETIAYLEGKIDAIVEKYKSISEEFKTLLDVYMDKYVNEQTVSISKEEYETPKLISVSFIKLGIKTIGPMCVVVCCIYILLVLNQKRRNLEVN